MWKPDGDEPEMDPAQDYEACAHAENVHFQPISRHGREMGSQRVLQMHELTIRAIAHNDHPRVICLVSGACRCMAQDSESGGF